MASHLSMLRRGGAQISNSALKAHLDGLAQKRGVPAWFDRFEPHTLSGSGPDLHLDQIRVARSAPTVVFMPGTNAYALLYGEFLCALADAGYNVVGFDPRGHGRSSGARGSYVLPDLIDDLDRVVEWTKSQYSGSVFVAGSSQGGITAFYYVLSGAPISGAILHNLADLSAPESALLTRFPRLSRALKPLICQLAQITPEFPVPMSAYLDLTVEPVRGLGNAQEVLLSDPLTVPFVRLRTLASLAHTPLPRDLKEPCAPLLILQAGADSIFPSDYIYDLYERLNTDKTMKVYPGLPHYMIVDSVDEFRQDVIDWLQARSDRNLQ